MVWLLGNEGWPLLTWLLPRQFFDDFSYWDMDQWDLATVPVGLN